MHVEILGEGPDLVLLHGWAMHGGVFTALTRHLQDRFRLHLVDLPGHGNGRADTGPLDPQDCAQQLLARLPRALWLGWSFGGLVALHAALEQPQMLRGIVAMAVSPRFVATPDWPHGVAMDVFAQFDAGLRTDYRATIARFLALETIGAKDAHATLRELKRHVFERGEPAAQVLAQGMRALERIDLRARLGALAVPSLWIAGRRDRLVPVAAVRWAAQQCPQARLLEIESGHAPFVAHCVAVADAISDFADTIPA